jgi:serine/threonine protein kinase
MEPSSPSQSGRPSAAPDPSLPTQLGGFRVVRRLASGGTSDVLLARAEGPHGFERLVALKVMLHRLRADPAFERMFAREASAYARLAHPAIVKMLDFFSADGQLVMVLEYVDGLPLNKLRAMLSIAGVRLDDRASIFIASRIFAALAAAHAARDPESGEFSPVIHRDINPSNVLIPWDGHVKLADFGIAKVSGQPGDTKSGFIKGTYGYMAPEQVRGESVTVRADVYAATLLLWELLARRKAIQRGALPEVEVLKAMATPQFPTLDSLRPDVAAVVRDAVRRGLEPHPDKRGITADEMGGILRGVIDGEQARGLLVETLARVRPAPRTTDLAVTQSRSASQADDTLVQKRPPLAALAAASPSAPPTTEQSTQRSRGSDADETARYEAADVDLFSTTENDAAPATARGAAAGTSEPPPTLDQPRPSEQPGEGPGTLPLPPTSKDAESRQAGVGFVRNRAPALPATTLRMGATLKSPDAAKAQAAERSPPSSAPPRSPARRLTPPPIPAVVRLPDTLITTSPASLPALPAAALAAAAVPPTGPASPRQPAPRPPAPAALAMPAPAPARVAAPAPAAVPRPAASPALAPTLPSGFPASPGPSASPALPPTPLPAFVPTATLPLGSSPLNRTVETERRPVAPLPDFAPRQLSPMDRTVETDARIPAPEPPPKPPLPIPLPPIDTLPPPRPRRGGWAVGVVLLVSACSVGIYFGLHWRRSAKAGTAVRPKVSATAGPTTSPPPSASAAAAPPASANAPAAASVTATAAAAVTAIVTAIGATGASASPAATATAPATAPTPAATTGDVIIPVETGGHRVYIDGRLAGQSPATFTVRCGAHSVRIGSAGTARQVKVPCGDSVTVSR